MKSFYLIIYIAKKMLIVSYCVLLKREIRVIQNTRNSCRIAICALAVTFKLTLTGKPGFF